MQFGLIGDYCEMAISATIARMRNLAILTALLALAGCGQNCDWWSCYDNNGQRIIPYIPPAPVVQPQQPARDIYGRQMSCTRYGNTIDCY